MSEVAVDEFEVFFTVQGHPKHMAMGVGPTVTVGEFARLAAEKGGIAELLAVFIEDEDDALEMDVVLVEHLAGNSQPLHVGKDRKIATTVHYATRHVERDFQPSVTVLKVITWAIGPDGLGLEGTPSDFQLKHDGHVVPDDRHLGQIAHGKDSLSFELVFKVKPQG